MENEESNVDLFKAKYRLAKELISHLSEQNGILRRALKEIHESKGDKSEGWCLWVKGVVRNALGDIHGQKKRENDG